jgi:CRISPR-associated protein Csd1
MALDENRKTRDYLYGRLLALADSLEQWALNVAGEKRQTNAARLMQRFADHPYSTWRTIEISLAPYKARLGGKANKRQDLIDQVHSMFDPPEDFTSDRKLSGEFLLGYHCQREALRKKSGDTSENEPETVIENNE